jgi:hypothetical protein
MSARDREWEAQMCRDADELCQRVHGVTPVGFAREVHARLLMGQAIYGTAAADGGPKYMEIDCAAEAILEPPDITSYLLLELQKQRSGTRDEEWQELRMLALEAMAAAGAAWEALHRFRRLRDTVVPQI